MRSESPRSQRERAVAGAASRRRPAAGRWGGWAAGITLALAIVTIHRVNPRCFMGFHGVIHTAVTYSILDGDVPPDNPFASGLPLPYYWMYHLLLAALVRLLRCPPIAAAEIVNLVAIVTLAATVVSLGRWLLGSLRAGLLVLALVMFGANPLGPLFLARRVLSGATSLAIDYRPEFAWHPMIWDMYLGFDAPWGSYFPFFLQPSSRCVAFLAAFLTVGLVCRSLARLSSVRAAGIVVCAALACAMNPVIGLGTVSGLIVGLVLVAQPWRRRNPGAVPALWRLVGALLLGPLVAFPAYGQIAGGESIGFPVVTSAPILLEKGVRVALFAAIPVSLTFVAWRRDVLRRPQLRVLALAGLALLVASCVTRVRGGREHSLFNQGFALLCLPAASACTTRRRGPSPRSVRRTALAAMVCMAPPACVCAVAFVHRAPITLQRTGLFVRQVDDADRAAVYAWLAEQTPSNAVVLFDVRDGPQTAFFKPESEIPAMTRRRLFVDVHGYLLPQDPRVAERRSVVAAVFDASPLTPRQAQTLRSLNRPLFALCRSPDDDRALTASGNPALCRMGPYSIYRLSMLDPHSIR